METSAKNATNVEQSFMTMAAEIKKRMGPGATAGGAEKSNVKIQSTQSSSQVEVAAKICLRPSLTAMNLQSEPK